MARRMAPSPARMADGLSVTSPRISKGPVLGGSSSARSGRRGAAQGQSLEELEELARSAGADVVGRLVQRSATTDPRYLIGAGKAMELRDRCRAEAVDLVIFNTDLSPAQTSHLELMVGVKVVDRTQLILDIFAQRARSREGKLQVELAQLRYLLPRLTGKGTELSRLGGGIGTRGPGETKLESDRRRIRQRIRSLERNIVGVARTRTVQRRRRSRGSEAHSAVPMVALVGYTNAGKSTLFNALTGAGVVVQDRLFATLDPTIRHVTLPHKTVVALSDTVGFVRNLPHALIAAFRATLEEVRHAQCLLHIIDRSHPEWQEQAAAVERVLTELDVAATPRITVYNKMDAVEPGMVTSESAASGPEERPGRRSVVAISALKRQGLDQLAEAIEAAVCLGVSIYQLSIPVERGDLMALLHEKGQVIKRTSKGRAVLFSVALTDAVIARWGDQWAPFFIALRGSSRGRPSTLSTVSG